MENHNIVFGKTLRRLRNQSCLTQENLGFESGLDRTYISLLELGQRSPTLDTIVALAHALGVEPAVFMVGVK